MTSFREIETADILDLISEADRSKAFLPSINEPEFSVERFLSQENFPGYRLFGICDDSDRIDGFISIKPKEDGSIIIGPMYIAESSRRMGLGKLQVEKLLDWAIAHNINTISTKTWGRNKGSRRIFEELGFKLTEEKPNVRINGDSTVKYLKKIG